MTPRDCENEILFDEWKSDKIFILGLYPEDSEKGSGTRSIIESVLGKEREANALLDCPLNCLVTSQFHCDPGLNSPFL